MWMLMRTVKSRVLAVIVVMEAGKMVDFHVDTDDVVVALGYLIAVVPNSSSSSY